MAIQLDNPEILNDTISKIDLDATTLDWENRTLHIIYNELAADNHLVRGGNAVSVNNEAYTNFLFDLATRLDIPVGNVVLAFKQSCLQVIIDETGKKGTLSE